MKRIGAAFVLALLMAPPFSSVLRAAPPAGYYLVWTDEFNGSSLDSSKWGYRFLGPYRDAVNTRDAVSLNGSNLVITTYTEGGTNYTAMLTGASKFNSRYGYWETRIKWSDSNAVWSAFWLMGPRMWSVNGGPVVPTDPSVSGLEIDACEHRYADSRDRVISDQLQVAMHYFDGASDQVHLDSGQIGGGLATGFHTYGFLWTPSAYSFTIDAMEVYDGGPAPISHTTEYPLLSSAVDETSTTWAGHIPEGGYGDRAHSVTRLTVDYVRYYAPNYAHFWTGASSTDWNNSANWISGLLPAADSDLTFSYLSKANRSMNLGQDYTIHGLVFLDSGGAFSVNGANTLTLGAGGVDTIGANRNVTLNAPIRLAADQTWSVGPNSPGKTLTVNASLFGSAMLTKASYGTLVLKGTNSFSGRLNVDTGSSITNDGALKIANSASVAHVASPIWMRNTGAGLSKLQLDGSAGNLAIPQLISMAGRSNSLPAIQSLSGTNSLAAGLALAPGGPNYVLESDAGTLILGGIAGGAATSGSLLTFQGNGDFSLLGPIQSGGASALGILKTNSGTLNLSGANACTGATTIAGGTLSGTASVAGPGTVQSGATIAPGSTNSLGTLAFGGDLTLAPGSTNFMRINKALQTNDQLQTAGVLTYGGTLEVTNLDGTLAAGDRFKLFSAGVYTGSFSGLVLPALTGLAWSTNELANGVLSVALPPLLRGWGDNAWGQADVPGATNAVAVAAGAWHSLALLADGRVLAWGNNQSGQCTVPASLTNALAIAAGGYHSLAIRADGSVATWGANDYGQCTVPSDLGEVIAVAAGTWHSLALRRDGTVAAWGDNGWDQSTVPPGLSNVVAIAAGGNHSLALRADGTVVAWGDNTDAYGSFSGESVVPSGLTNVVGIAAGKYHSLACRADGTVVPWGDNSQGQCTVPVGLSNVVALAGGGGHSLALKSDGTVAAWGLNLDGQCSLAQSATGAVGLSAGENHTLVLLGGSPPVPRLLRPAWRDNSFSALAQTLNRTNYVLEFTPSLALTNWSALSTNAGNGALRLLTDPGAGAAQRCYRMRLAP